MIGARATRPQREEQFNISSTERFWRSHCGRGARAPGETD